MCKLEVDICTGGILNNRSKSICVLIFLHCIQRLFYSSYWYPEPCEGSTEKDFEALGKDEVILSNTSHSAVCVLYVRANTLDTYYWSGFCFPFVYATKMKNHHEKKPKTKHQTCVRVKNIVLCYVALHSIGAKKLRSKSEQMPSQSPDDATC